MALAKPACFPRQPRASQSSSLEYGFHTEKEEAEVHDLYRLRVSAFRTLEVRVTLLSQGEHSVPLSNREGRLATPTPHS